MIWVLSHTIGDWHIPHGCHVAPWMVDRCRRDIKLHCGIMRDAMTTSNRTTGDRYMPQVRQVAPRDNETVTGTLSHTVED